MNPLEEYMKNTGKLYDFITKVKNRDYPELKFVKIDRAFVDSTWNLISTRVEIENRGNKKIIKNISSPAMANPKVKRISILGKQFIWGSSSFWFSPEFLAEGNEKILEGAIAHELSHIVVDDREDKSGHNHEMEKMVDMDAAKRGHAKGLHDALLLVDDIAEAKGNKTQDCSERLDALKKLF